MDIDAALAEVYAAGYSLCSLSHRVIFSHWRCQVARASSFNSYHVQTGTGPDAVSAILDALSRIQFAASISSDPFHYEAREDPDYSILDDRPNTSSSAGTLLSQLGLSKPQTITRRF